MGFYTGSGGKPSCYALETGSYGNADTPDVALDLVNESLRENTEPLRSPAPFGSRAFKTYHKGTKSAGGDIRFIAQPDSLPKLIYGVLGAEANASQVVGTQAEITEITCEADVSGSLSGKYWTLNAPGTEYYVWYDVAGKGSDDPAPAGKTEIVVGISENATASEVATATKNAIDETDFGASVNAAVVTVTNASNGAVEDAADGTGGLGTGWTDAWSVTQQGSGGAAYDHVFTPAGAGVDLPSFHFEVDKHGTVCTFPGSVIDTMTIEFTKGAYLEIVMSLLCQKELDDQTSTDLSLSTKQPYIGDFVQMQVSGSGVTYGIGGSIQIQNFIDADASHRMDGTRFRAQPRPQNFMVSGSIDLEWSSDTDALRDAIKDNSNVDLTFVCTSEEAIEAGYYYTVTFDIPTCRLIGDLPVVSTRDRIPFTINFEGIYNATNLMAITHRDARTTKWSA